ncbi:hypothetical protein BJ508DRAFT_356990 [Ascobolus immersus RN42]|uniref:Extracellular membrane protein CFEM domain-containing protein n=1 Tax=Ascobolus immersus RN42 TaxID=1160509 RepID=A0A3N4IS73_ASCIM|nr:hypothetical protein BJ508DRAFT_356990 [Ascobolus immersus RN42]
MRFSVVTILLAASSIAAAQKTCAAKPILERCLETTKPQIANCDVQDWECLCARQTDVLTCFNNCPQDEGIHAQQATVTAICNAAKQVADSNSRASEAEESTKTTAVASSTKITDSPSPTTTPTGDETEEENAPATEEEDKDSAAAPVGVQKLFVAGAALVAAAFL